MQRTKASLNLIDASTNIIVIGRFARTYGVYGWIKLISFTEPFENILTYTKDWLIGQHHAWEPLKVSEAKSHGQIIIAKIPGFDTPETARQFSGAEVGIHRYHLPSLDKNTVYICDLPGYQVNNQTGEFLGTIESVFYSGAHEILSIKGEVHYLIPFIRDEFVMDINKTERRMTVAWASDDTA